MEDLADDLHAVLTACCSREKPLLIGWSMGGATVLEYLRKYGCENVDRVLIVDYVPKMLNDSTWHLGRLDGSYDETSLEADLSLMRADFYGFLAKYYGESNPAFGAMSTQEQQQMVITRMKGHDPITLTALWDSLCRADYRESLRDITVPVMVFHADILPLCPPEAATFYRDEIPNAQTIQFENASHALMVEYPDLFCSRVREFYE